jgi:hypothetical protein
MRRAAILPLVFFTAALAACGSMTNPLEITGNNTGGVIPAGLLAKGQDSQQLANGHCAKYGSAARITFNPIQAGGEVVFVCESAAPPPPPAQPLPAGPKAKQAPAAKQTPVR